MGLWSDYHLDNPRLEPARLPQLGYIMAFVERWFVSGEVAGNHDYYDTHHFEDLIEKLDWLHEHQDNWIMPRLTKTTRVPKSLEKFNQSGGNVSDSRLFEKVVPYFWNGTIKPRPDDEEEGQTGEPSCDEDDLRDWGEHHCITKEWLEGQLGERIVLESELPRFTPIYNADWLAQRTRILRLLQWGPCPFRLVYSNEHRTYRASVDYDNHSLTQAQLLGMVRETQLICDSAEESTTTLSHGSFRRQDEFFGYETFHLPFRVIIARGGNTLDIYVSKLKRLEMVLPKHAGETPTMLTFFLGMSGEDAYNVFCAGTAYKANKRYFLGGNTDMQNMFVGYIPPPDDLSRMCNNVFTGYHYGAEFRDVWGFADYTKSIFKFKLEG